VRPSKETKGEKGERTVSAIKICGNGLQVRFLHYFVCNSLNYIILLLS
jgi:hypothetical protein